MRLTIIAYGSHGDVQPYVALGVGLRAAGHHVRVATHDGFEAFVRRRGLDFSTVAGDPRQAMESDEGRAWMEREHAEIVVWRGLRRWAEHLMRQRLADCLRACRDADLIVSNPLGLLLASSLAEYLRVPLVRVFPLPATPTRSYPVALVPSAVHLGGRFNVLTHHAAAQLLWLLFRSQANAARRSVLRLPPLPLREPFGEMDRRRTLLLYCYSPAAAPPPPDWAEWAKVTGFWFLDRPADWEPPASLVDFLEAGPPPVYVGFGSLTSRDAEQTTDLVVRALRRAGRRGVLLKGWGGLSESVRSADVYTIEGVPHDWLFPRMAAVVHHGGMGTTAEGLRAGVPSIVIPRLLDQRFWSQRVYQLGVGPRPIPHRHLSSERLAAAIHAATTDRAMQLRADSLGNTIRGERGVAVAVEAIQRHVAQLR